MKVKLLIDTDLGGDCDDVGAIALANILKNKEQLELLGMTHTTSLPWGVCCIDIINRYYQNPMELGANMDENYCNENCNTYAQKMAESFFSSYQDRNDAEEATHYLRRILSKQEDHSITIVCIGQLINMARLLQSQKDEFAEENGIELVRKKVKEFVVMGGLFTNENEKVFFEGQQYDIEYNIACDIPSARYFIRHVPVRVTFSDFLCGNQIHTLGPLIKKKDMSNPVTFAYVHFSNKARESWDLLTLYYAVYHDQKIFSVSENGTISIDQNGKTTFSTKKKSNHFYLKLKENPIIVEQQINQYFTEESL